MAVDDPKLARLYDYTKWHIGIYLIAAGSMVTIAGSDRISNLLGDVNRTSVIIAIGAMAVSGIAGGVIASSCASANDFYEVWTKRIGPWYLRVMPGWCWALVEHTAFWTSLAALAIAILQ